MLKVISLAGARYTPKLNVSVSIASVFDGLGRTTAFYDQLKKPGNEVLKKLRSVKEEEIAKVAPKEFAKTKRECVGVANLILKIPNSGVQFIDFKRIERKSKSAKEGLADFGRYVVNSSVDHWCNLKLKKDGTRSKTVKELDAEFKAGLNGAQKVVWQKLETDRGTLSLARFMTRMPFREGEKTFRQPKPGELQKEERRLRNTERTFVRSLSPELRSLYRNGVLRSGSTNLNRGISGNSGHRAGLESVWQ